MSPVVGENFLSHSAENFREGIRLFLRKLLFLKIFTDEKGGRISFFRRRNMVSQCRKISWAPLQCFRKIRVSKKTMHIRGVTIFRRKLSVSQCRKFLWRSHTVLRKCLIPKTVYGLKGGVSRIAVKNFWSPSTENLREHLCNVSEKLC